MAAVALSRFRTSSLTFVGPSLLLASMALVELARL
mgnify:FL=1